MSDMIHLYVNMPENTTLGYSFATIGEAMASLQDGFAAENVVDSTSQSVASEEAGQSADGFTYPMDAVTLTVNGSVDGSVDYYDDSQHPTWAKDLYYFKVIRDKTGVSLKDVGGAANASTMSDGFLLMLASGELPDIIIAPWNTYTGGAAAAIDDGYVVERSPHAKLHNGFKKACRTQDTDAVRRKHNNSE